MTFSSSFSRQNILVVLSREDTTKVPGPINFLDLCTQLKPVVPPVSIRSIALSSLVMLFSEFRVSSPVCSIACILTGCQLLCDTRRLPRFHIFNLFDKMPKPFQYSWPRPPAALHLLPRVLWHTPAPYGEIRGSRCACQRWTMAGKRWGWLQWHQGCQRQWS